MASTTDKNSRVATPKKTGKSGKPSSSNAGAPRAALMKASKRNPGSRSGTPEKAMRPVTKSATVIESCINNELRRYFDMLDGEEPSHMYRMVVRQAESALIRSVMVECRGNQTKASEWLGISRGNLRNKLATMDDTQK